MGVIKPERRFLLFQMFNHTRQNDVLQDIGVIAGVIGVTVIHGVLCRLTAQNRKGLADAAFSAGNDARNLEILRGKRFDMRAGLKS